MDESLMSDDEPFFIECGECGPVAVVTDGHATDICPHLHEFHAYDRVLSPQEIEQLLRKLSR